MDSAGIYLHYPAHNTDQTCHICVAVHVQIDSIEADPTLHHPFCSEWIYDDIIDLVVINIFVMGSQSHQ